MSADLEHIGVERLQQHRRCIRRPSFVRAVRAGTFRIRKSWLSMGCTVCIDCSDSRARSSRSEVSTPPSTPIMSVSRLGQSATRSATSASSEPLAKDATSRDFVERDRGKLATADWYVGARVRLRASGGVAGSGS